MKQTKQLNPGSLGLEQLLPKLLLLTAVKEVYLLLANSYGLLFHPYLTVKRIVADRSQAGIFMFLWLSSWLTLGGVGIAYLFINKWSPFGGQLFGLGLLTIFVSAILLLSASGYLVYWIFLWWYKKQKGRVTCNF